MPDAILKVQWSCSTPLNPPQQDSYSILEDTRDPEHYNDYGFIGSAYGPVIHNPLDKGLGEFTVAYTAYSDAPDGRHYAQVTWELSDFYSTGKADFLKLWGLRDIRNEPLDIQPEDPGTCKDKTYYAYFINGIGITSLEPAWNSAAPGHRYLWAADTHANPLGILSDTASGGIQGGYTVYPQWSSFSERADGPYRISAALDGAKVRLTSIRKLRLREYRFGAEPSPVDAGALSAWQTTPVVPTCADFLPQHHAVPHPLCPKTFKQNYLEIYYEPSLTTDNDVFVPGFNAECP